MRGDTLSTRPYSNAIWRTKGIMRELLSQNARKVVARVRAKLDQILARPAFGQGLAGRPGGDGARARAEVSQYRPVGLGQDLALDLDLFGGRAAAHGDVHIGEAGRLSRRFHLVAGRLVGGLDGGTAVG